MLINYFDFINSKDVREYLTNINYSLTPSEKAWIVFHSGKNLPEKCVAMQEILSTTEDCNVTVDNHYKYQGSLHRVLEKTVEMWQKEISNLSKEEKAADCNETIGKTDSFAFFRYMDVDFPLPFSNGDILKYYDDDFYKYSCCPIIFVKKNATAVLRNFQIVRIEYFRQHLLLHIFLHRTTMPVVLNAGITI